MQETHRRDIQQFSGRKMCRTSSDRILNFAIFSLFAFVSPFHGSWLTGTVEFRHRSILERGGTAVPLLVDPFVYCEKQDYLEEVNIIFEN